jgi:phage repressor protein C with HTH and peptisase S24 domain
MDLKWIAELLDRPGFSQAGLARALGKDAAAVNRMLKGDRLIKAHEIPVILDYLQTEPQPGDRAAAFAVSGRMPATQMRRLVDGNGRPEVPVWASAEAGNDGAMVLVNDPIDYIRRSERMQGVKDPFAFYVIGDSMSPAIEHGDQVVVNPAHPVQPGKDHVFLQEQEDGTILALVKRLLKSTPAAWRVRQFHPAKDFDLPKKKWAKALWISEKRVG